MIVGTEPILEKSIKNSKVSHRSGINLLSKKGPVVSITSKSASKISLNWGKEKCSNHLLQHCWVLSVWVTDWDLHICVCVCSLKLPVWVKHFFNWLTPSESGEGYISGFGQFSSPGSDQRQELSHLEVSRSAVFRSKSLTDSVPAVSS